jgi:hypothetical protein
VFGDILKRSLKVAGRLVVAMRVANGVEEGLGADLNLLEESNEDMVMGGAVLVELSGNKGKFEVGKKFTNTFKNKALGECRVEGVRAFVNFRES